MQTGPLRASATYHPKAGHVQRDVQRDDRHAQCRITSQRPHFQMFQAHCRERFLAATAVGHVQQRESSRVHVAARQAGSNGHLVISQALREWGLGQPRQEALGGQLPGGAIAFAGGPDDGHRPGSIADGNQAVALAGRA